MKNLLFVNGNVGNELACWLLTEYKDDVGLICTYDDNLKVVLSKKFSIPIIKYSSENNLIRYIERFKMQFSYGFLLWWPTILSKRLLTIPKFGFVNTHPSLLPFNRGKHYNFWAIVEQNPFGVSLHFADTKVDEGDVLFQRHINYGWEDNGQSLHKKAVAETINLFKEKYPLIRENKYKRVPQETDAGSFHLSSEMNVASEIDLEKKYKARDLLNLLRARTFDGYPSCFFKENDEKFNVKITIEKSDDG